MFNHLHGSWDGLSNKNTIHSLHSPPRAPMERSSIKSYRRRRRMSSIFYVMKSVHSRWTRSDKKYILFVGERCEVRFFSSLLQNSTLEPIHKLSRAKSLFPIYIEIYFRDACDIPTLQRLRHASCFFSAFNLNFIFKSTKLWVGSVYRWYK